MKLKWILFGLLVVCFVITVTSVQASQSNANLNIGLAMGLRLFDRVCEEAPADQNVLISPNSAFSCLSMVTNGAGSATLTELLKALGANSIDSLNAENRKSIDSLKDLNKSVVLESANAIFADNRAPIDAKFIDICKRVYGAEARNENFDSPEALASINKWCSDKTHGKITSILSELNHQDVMVLLNALYFNGTWEWKFKPEQTHPAKFNKLDATQSDVSMMRQTRFLNYLETDGFRSIEMQYKGGQTSMFVFLPDKGVSLKNFRERITVENWNKWMNAYQSQNLDVQLPKFKMSFARELNSSLEQMGVKEAFIRHTADFSKLVTPPHRAYISLVVQKTYMDVNEQGTEAAAVTAIAVATARAMTIAPKPFIVDRPFVIALRNNVTGELLFLGQIVDPKVGS